MNRFFIAAIAAFMTTTLFAQKLEKPDVYEFSKLAPPKEYKRDGKLILDPDFFCSFCAKQKKIKAKTRAEVEEAFLKTKRYRFEFQGRKKRTFGEFRLMETPGQDLLDWLRKENNGKKATYIEDDWFRVYSDLPGFSTKKVRMPRREGELLQLHSVFPRVTEKTVSIRPEHVAHLYRLRAHRILDDFKGLVDFKAKRPVYDYVGPWMGMNNRFEIYIFRKRKNLVNFATYTLGQDSKENDGFVWHHLKDRSMVVAMHAEGLDDDELNNAFTHRMSFALVSALKSYKYDVPNWVQMGLSHLFERREFTGYNTYIFGEGRRPKIRTLGKWKVYVRKAVVKKKIEPLSAWVALDGKNAISWDKHPYSWSLMSYLMTTNQKGTGKFVSMLKEKKDGESVRNLVRRCLKVALNTTVTRLDEEWRAWVIATYPPF